MLLQFSKNKEKQIVKQINPQRSRHRLLHLHVSLWRKPHNVPRCKWILVFVVSNIIIGVYIYSSTEIDLTFRQLGYEGGRITFAGTDRVKHCGIKINAIEEKDNGEWKWVRIHILLLFIATSSQPSSPYRHLLRPQIPFACQHSRSPCDYKDKGDEELGWQSWKLIFFTQEPLFKSVSSSKFELDEKIAWWLDSRKMPNSLWMLKQRWREIFPASHFILLHLSLAFPWALGIFRIIILFKIFCSFLTNWAIMRLGARSQRTRTALQRRAPDLQVWPLSSLLPGKHKHKQDKHTNNHKL